jgi:CubicO group peptidase (beta-lactamase class C family)
MARRGKVVYHNAWGKQDIREAASIAPDSIYRIFSMTKVVTGAAMMMLYEEGKWRIDDPVARHIPEFARMQVYTGQNQDGSMQLEAARPMTMRHLMTHTAGLGYGLGAGNPVDRMFRENRIMNPTRPLQAMIDQMGKTPLLAQPGTRWVYSSAVDVQGYLVEKFSGMSFADFLRTRIFEPLGMKDTGFHVPEAKLSRLALEHGEQGGKLTPPTNTRQMAAVVPVGASGGGGLYSTAADYARFAQMLLDGGQLNGVRLLSPRTVEMMRTNQLPAEAAAGMRGGTGWGLGPQVIVDAAASGEPWRDGTFWWYGIGGTWFWIDPASDLVFVGMIAHSALPTAAEIRNLSHNLAYQAITD